jgi:hypothetical protein
VNSVSSRRRLHGALARLLLPCAARRYTRHVTFSRPCVVSSPSPVSLDRPRCPPESPTPVWHARSRSCVPQRRPFGGIRQSCGLWRLQDGRFSGSRAQWGAHPEDAQPLALGLLWLDAVLQAHAPTRVERVIHMSCFRRMNAEGMDPVAVVTWARLRMQWMGVLRRGVPLASARLAAISHYDRCECAHFVSSTVARRVLRRSETASSQ